MSDTLDALRAIWEQRRENILARSAAIQRAVDAAIDGTLEAPVRAAAAREAHMLAGSAGTFGFRRASELARELEGQLEGDAPLDPAGLPRMADAAGELNAELQGSPGAEPDDGLPEPAAARADRPALLIFGEPELAGRRLPRRPPPAGSAPSTSQPWRRPAPPSAPAAQTCWCSTSPPPRASLPPSTCSSKRRCRCPSRY